MSGRILVAILGILLVSGCAMHQKKVMHTLENPAPVNCATAEGDLRVLQGEKDPRGRANPRRNHVNHAGWGRARDSHVDGDDEVEGRRWQVQQDDRQADGRDQSGVRTLAPTRR